MNTYLSVGCLDTVDKDGFVCWFWPTPKGQYTDHLSTMNCKIILTCIVKDTVQWYCMLVLWFI